MTTLSKRFVQVAEILNLKNADIVKKYNISRQNVNNFFTVQKTMTENFAKVCDGENININWLLTGNGEMFINNLPVISSKKELSCELVSLNFYPEVYAAAGYGAINTNATKTNIEVSKNFLNQLIDVRKYDELDVIRVYGDSMEPYISNGEFVIIEKNAEAKNGETIIANINGEIYIKKYKADPFKQWVKLLSENGAYDEILIEGKNLELLNIVGIVRAKIKPF